MDEDRDDDEMDWMPTDPSASSRRNAPRKALTDDDDGSWLRKQRFFPPEQPTGLEGLFARTLLMDDTDSSGGQSPRDGTLPRHKLKLRWWWIAAFLIIPTLGIAYRLGWRWDLTITRRGLDIPNPASVSDPILESLPSPGFDYDYDDTI